MNHNLFLRYFTFLLVIGGAFSRPCLAQEAANFSGEWVLKLGSRPLVVVTLAPSPGGAGPYAGVMARPQHFSSNNGVTFSGIKGPVVSYPIVRDHIEGDCLIFTAQNPSDKSDEDEFRLCAGAQGNGSLKFNVPGFEAGPVTRGKGPTAVATDWDNTRTYFLDDTDVSNAEMQKIFEIDQKVREPGVGKIDWGVVGKTDAERREATRRLLADGKLHTGEDFERAAFIFQHGSTPEDYLLAHTLAMIAVARGHGSALWIASATLDRYLNSIRQPQIYGTQYYFKPNEPTSQEPYNRTLISDALRRLLGVPSQAAQEEQRKLFEAGRTKH